jgi:hypothetical protein
VTEPPAPDSRPGPSPTRNRRRWVRANRRIYFMFVHADDPDTVFGFVARNISAGGMFVIHDRRIPPGTPLEVEIDFNDGTAIAPARATVLRCDEIKPGVYGLALELTRIAESAREQLDAFVQRHLDDPPLPDVERYLLPNYVEELRRRTDEAVRAMLHPGSDETGA